MAELTQSITVRMTPTLMRLIETAAAKEGEKSISDFIRKFLTRKLSEGGIEEELAALRTELEHLLTQSNGSSDAQLGLLREDLVTTVAVMFQMTSGSDPKEARRTAEQIFRRARPSE